jgi:hypothetical protein
MTDDQLPVPEVDPLAELPEITPYGRNWEPAPVSTCPAPIRTAAESYASGDRADFPAVVDLLERKARSLGWETRAGMALGYKPGRSKGPWVRLDLMGVWLAAPVNPHAWKAGSALLFGTNGTVKVNHTEGKRRMAWGT